MTTLVPTGGNVNISFEWHNQHALLVCSTAVFPLEVFKGHELRALCILAVALIQMFFPVD